MIRKQPISHTLLALFVLFSAAGISACGEADKPAEKNSTVVPVRVQTVSKTPVVQAHRFSGTVQGTQKVQLSTKMLGRITHLRIQEGEAVRRGQVLARIQSDGLEAQKEQVLANMREAEAGLVNAKTNYERIKALYATQSATQKEFDDISTHYKMAQARLAAVKGKLGEINDVLDYAVITSPIEGYVVQRNAQQGDMASPGMPLLVVEKSGSLEVIAQIPEGDVGQVMVGDKVGIEIGALDHAKITGEVTQVNPSGRMGSRQFDVRVKLPESEETKPVKSGMYAKVLLNKGLRNVISVPASALHQRGQLTGLYTLDGEKRALLRWVRTGKTIEGQVEILSGLADGELFVISSEGRLADGQQVQVLQ